MTLETSATEPRTASPWMPSVAVIEETWPETPGVVTYRLITPGKSTADYSFKPGQFNMLYLPGFGEAAISMSGPPPGGGNRNAPLGWIHTIRQAGNVTTALARLKNGDKLAIRGPYGKGWPLGKANRCDVILMAGGIGLAPLRPAVYELLARRGDFGRLILLMGARTAEGLLYRTEYDEWEKRGFEIHLIVDRADGGWAGNVGVVPLLLDRLRLAQPGNTLVYACGPEVMMRYAALGAISQGISANQIWVSLERHMNCAVGLCGHCQLGTELLCRDGPVYPWNQVQPLLQVPDL
jgi:NAD(P)H-flavin reductase